MEKIPDFETLDEEVEFWETHDSAEYLDDMEEAEIESNLRYNLFHPKAVILTRRPQDCPRCKSELDDITIEYADWSNDHLLIIRDVSALKCKVNGHEYVLEAVLDQIEHLFELEKNHQLKPTAMMEVPVFSLKTVAA